MSLKTIAISAIAIAMLTGLSGCLKTGSGSHVGYITACECDGVLTHACRLYLKTDTQSTQEDRYCVDDEHGGFEALWTAIQDAQAHKAHVEVRFHSEAATWWSRCHDDNDIVDSIRRVA